MARGKGYASQHCTIARSLEVVGERWTLLVVRDAFCGVRRYNDFLVHLGIPRAVLVTRLQDLAEVGVLEKRRYQESPPREEYVLTERGPALWPTVYSLAVWGRGHVSGTLPMRTFRHTRCGTGLGPFGEWPVCGVSVRPHDVGKRPGRGLGPEPSNPVSRALLEPFEATRAQ